MTTNDAEDEMMVVPWNCSEDTWSEESHKTMHRLIQMFKSADADGDGVIGFHDLRGLLERVGDGSEPVPMHWLTDEDIQAVIKQYDTNGDGVIQWEEFVAMAQDNIFLSGKLSEYRDAFRAVDAGGNGTISATELYRLFERLEHPITYDQLVKIMERYDVDQSGMIDFGEFLRMFRNELLDLQEILQYVKISPRATPTPTAAPPSPPTARPETPSGAVTTFFSAHELELILHASTGRLVVVEASLTWCKPCKTFQPTYEKLAAHYKNVTFLKFYGNSNDSTKHLFKEILKARSTPAFFIFLDGQAVNSCTGANGSRLEHHIRKSLPAGKAPEAMLPEYEEEEK